MHLFFSQFESNYIYIDPILSLMFFVYYLFRMMFSPCYVEKIFIYSLFISEIKIYRGWNIDYWLSLFYLLKYSASLAVFPSDTNENPQKKLTLEDYEIFSKTWNCGRKINKKMQKKTPSRQYIIIPPNFHDWWLIILILTRRWNDILNYTQ